jgi:hypothetical protein
MKTCYSIFGMTVRLVFVTGVLSITWPQENAHADWIKGYFAPNAGIDSINRFLVIRDYRDSTRLGYSIIPAGDLNHDGIGDMIACRVGYSNIIDDTSFSFLGGRPPSGNYHQVFPSLNWTMGNIGDLNGDGNDDFGQQRLRQAPVRFELRLGGPLLTDSVWAYIPNINSLLGETKVADFDVDGDLELALVRDIDSGSVKIFRVSPSVDTVPEFIIRDTSQNFGDNLAVGDFNGDGVPDLAIAASYNRYVAPPFVKFYWGGPALIPSRISLLPTPHLNSELFSNRWAISMVMGTATF